MPGSNLIPMAASWMNYLKQHHERFLNELVDYLRIPSVSAQSAHKEEAYAFATFIATDDESAFIRAVEGRQLPSHAAVYDRPEVSGDPVLAGFREQFNNSMPMPNYAEMTLMWSPVTTAMNKITKGSASPEAGLKAAQAELTKSVAALRTGR